MTPEVLERFILTTLQNATAAAALNAAHARGRDDRNFADQLAVEAMRDVLNRELMVSAQVVIGEGERDEAPMLHIGEKLGPWSLPARANNEPELFLAVDPLEGTNLCARGEPGALCVIAAALDGEGSLLAGIDGYFNKIVLSADLVGHIAMVRSGAGYVFPHEQFGSLLDMPIPTLVRHIASWRRKKMPDVVAMVLERPRNQKLIDELRALNVQIKLIRDGDITAGLLALDPRHDVDIAIGIGAAAEGVITAAMTRVYGGYMEARWWFPENVVGTDQKVRVQKLGLDLHRVYGAEDLASGHVMFSATAVTANDMLPGVRYEAGGVVHTHTVSGRSRTGTLNVRHSIHQRPPAPPKHWPGKGG